MHVHLTTIRRTVPVADVHLAPGSVASATPQKVAEYASRLSDSEPPPIRVVPNGEAYLVADGRHRLLAAQQIGRTHIDALAWRVEVR